MIKHKRISNKFVWVPPKKRGSRFPGPLPPRKPETRIPLFYFDRDGDDVYFVNNSTETLNRVTSNSGGLQTLDDESMPVGGPTYSYKDVKPGEAVKVENYDSFYDSDFLLYYCGTLAKQGSTYTCRRGHNAGATGVVTFKCSEKLRDNINKIS
jgi:hypothetical protein